MATTYSAPNTTEGPTCRIDLIRPSAINPRKQFDPEKLADLAESIQTHGLLEPIVVREVDGETIAHPEPGYTSVIVEYEIVAGERRWRACKLAGLTEVPIRNLGVVDDRTALELALVENLQRVDLDPIEEAEGYRQLNRVVGLTQAAIAAAVKRSQPAVANAMRLLDLPEDVRARISAGELSVSHGVALCRFRGFPALIDYVAGKIIPDKMTAKDIDGLDLSGYYIQHKGLTRKLKDWDTAFDFKQEGCEDCPFGAFRLSGGVAVCLRPEHYAELQAAGMARKADEARALAEASGKGVGDAPTMEQLRAKCDFRDLGWEVKGGRAPAGCGDDCPCRSHALDHRNELNPICLDPARYNALQKQADEALKLQRKERHRARLAAAGELVDQATMDDARRELVVLVGRAVKNAEKSQIDGAIKRLGLKLDSKPLVQRDGDRQAKIYRALARLSPIDLLRLGVEVVMRFELDGELAGYGNAGGPVDWYLKAGTGADDAAPAGEGQDA